MTGSQRALILVLLIVGSFLLFAYSASGPGLAYPLALVMSVVLWLTRYVWRPRDYGRNLIRRYSLWVLLAAHLPYPIWAPWVNHLLHPLPFPAPPNAPSATLQMSILIGVVAINYLTRDSTVMGEYRLLHDGRSDRELRDDLVRVGRALKNDLNRIDDETNWSTEYFEPLDALVEIREGTHRKRGIKKLLPAIRADRRSTTFLVLGDPGSGKSVALRKLAHDLIAEIGRTGKLPVYIDLKEWKPATKWTRDNPPTANDFYAFLKWRLDRHVFVRDFLSRPVGTDSMFVHLLKRGRFFFILDSFDEIPQVLNDEQPESWLLGELSNAIHGFLAGGFEVRGVLASRLFRQPTRAFAAQAVLELRPFTDMQIRDSLDKTKAYGPAAVSEIFSSRPDLIRTLRNPFSASLLVTYSRVHRDQLPASQVDLYGTYLRSRLTGNSDIREALARRSEPLSEDQIVECAGAMATTLVDHFGLETTLRELSQGVGEWAPRWVADVELVAEILVHAKVARLGPPPGWRFSFAHRRFAEFFVAKSLAGQGVEQLESIPREEAKREALALYCEIADENTAREVAEYCWAEIRLVDVSDFRVSDPGFRRAVHCLRFLGSAFRARFGAMASFREELGDFVVGIVSKTEDILAVKLLVEGTGILTEKHIDRVVIHALTIGNAWVSETALRACRHLGKPSSTLVDSLRDYIDAIMPAEFWRRRGEFLFSLGLSDGFSVLRGVCKRRAADMVCGLIGLVMVMLVDPVAVFVAGVSLGMVLTLVRLSGLHIVSDRGVDWNTNLFMCRWLVVVMIGVALVGEGRTVTQGVPWVEWTGGVVASAVAVVGACLVVPYYQLGRLMRYGPGPLARMMVELLGYGVAMFVGMWAWTEVVEWLGWDREFLVRVMGIGFGLLLGGALGMRALENWAAWRRDKRCLAGLEMSGGWSRSQVAGVLDGLETATGRYRFLTMLEGGNVEPEGSWPERTLPSYGRDRASILLAQLEERWLGMAR